MEKLSRPTLGLALSGSGNRTTFYIGFLEVLNEAGIKIDYISACSGGSLVAAAYACGALEDLKEFGIKMDSKHLLKLLTKKRGHGGLYSLEEIEKIIFEKITKGKHFSDVKPMMSFTAVDIENRELVDLCMGDLARAAIISCTTPGLFEPVKWGNSLLVDGGLLSMVPIASLQKFKPDITVCVDMAYTRHIFSKSQINAKKFLNYIKQLLFIEQLGGLLKKITFNENSETDERSLNFMEVWGKSLDIAIEASKNYKEDFECDLIIKPRDSALNTSDIRAKSMERYYQIGRQYATDYLPQLRKLIESKEKYGN